MNLIQQFPDISQKIRAKVRRNYKPVNANYPLAYTEEEVVVKYYEREFRRWHFKLVFMIVASVGIIFFGLLKSGWVLKFIGG